MRVPRIYRIFKNKQVFNLDDVHKEMSDLSLRALRGHIEEGISSETIGQIRRRLYYIIPL